MSIPAQGRQDLARWRASVPVDFFSCDVNLQHVLQMYSPNYASYESALRAFGLAEAEWELARGLSIPKRDVLQFFMQRHLSSSSPLDDPDYAERLQRIVKTL